MSSSAIPGFADAPTKNKRLLAWVQEVAELTTPDRIDWCDGSDAEWNRLTQELVARKEFGRFSELSGVSVPLATNS